jgi:hypothetical protein
MASEIAICPRFIIHEKSAGQPMPAGTLFYGRGNGASAPPTIFDLIR